MSNQFLISQSQFNFAEACNSTPWCCATFFLLGPICFIHILVHILLHLLPTLPQTTCCLLLKFHSTYIQFSKHFIYSCGHIKLMPPSEHSEYLSLMHVKRKTRIFKHILKVNPITMLMECFKEISKKRPCTVGFKE